MAQNVRVSIKFVDPQLKRDDVVTEVSYLIEDLRDLEGMSQIRFEPIEEIRSGAEIKVGVWFEAAEDRLGAILRRLRDRLHYSPIDTQFSFQFSAVNLQIQTHQADALMGLMAMTQSRLLLYPERDYLAEAETYSRTQGELSPTELDNLNLLRQRLGLSAERAEALNARATGPYRTQAEKRQHLEEVTQAEFSRLRSLDDGPPVAPKAIWPLLQELSENLGLPAAVAAAIYQEHRQHYDADLQIKAEQRAAKAAEAAQLAAEAKAAADRQKQAQQAQEHRDQYRALCRQAMAHDLYPSEFDQGRLEQARRLHGISLPAALTLEVEVRDGLYGSVQSAAGVDYTRLRSLLYQQDWQAADLETEVAILKAINQDMQPVTAGTVQCLSATDLVTIDGLWSRHSGGRFGFKAQQQVYRSQQQIQVDEDKRWIDFQQMLGWREPPAWFYRGFRPYYSLNFSLDAPLGHLPTWRWACLSPNHRYGPTPEAITAIMAHLNDAMPLEMTIIPGLGPSLMAGGPTDVS